MIACLALAQDWEWVKQGSGTVWDYGASTCTDGAGNVYLFGSHGSDPFDMDGTTINGATAEGSLYLAKYDASGVQQWVRAFTGGGTGDILFDPGANALFVGGTLASHTTIFGSITLTGYGGNDAFIARFDLNGGCEWAKNCGGAGEDLFRTIAGGLNGDLVVAGPFASSNATVDGIAVQSGVVLASFNADGDPQWAERKFTAGPFGYVADFIALAAADDKIYGFGNTSAPNIVVDGVPYHSNNPIGGFQYFIARMDSVGTVEWIKPCGGMPYYTPYGDLELDGEGSFYVTGPFMSKGFFDEDTLQCSAQTTDMFLAKYDTAGTYAWSTQLGTLEFALGRDLLTDGSGGVYAMGFLKGEGMLDELPIDAGDSTDTFVAHFLSDGSCIGYVQVDHAFGRRMALAPDNAVYVAGDVTGTAEFTSSLSITSAGQEDAFLALSGRVVASVPEERSASDGELLIYANPNAGTCRIELPEALLQEQDLYLTIFDSTGRLVQQSRVLLEDGRVHLDIRAEAKGIYRVEVGNRRVRRAGSIVFE